MPATIRIDFDVHAEGISEALSKELSKIQGVIASANAAVETAKASSAVASAKKSVDEETKAVRSIAELKAKAEKDIEGVRSAFSSKLHGDEKKAATAIVNEIAKLQEQKDNLMRAAQIDGIGKIEQAQINAEKKKLDRELATTRRIALENKEIAEHGAGASVGIMGIGRNIEKNFDKANGMSKMLGASLGVAGGFTLSGLLSSAQASKESTERIKIVLSSANVPADKLAESVKQVKDHAAEFGDKMAIPRARVKEVAEAVIGLTGLTGKAANQATELALTIERTSGGMVSAEKFAKLLNKSVGDPENEKSLKIIEGKYPGIGKKMAEAANEQEKLNILQTAMSPAMAEMEKQGGQSFNKMKTFINSAKGEVTGFLASNMNAIGSVAQVSGAIFPMVGVMKNLSIVTKVQENAQKLWNMAMNASPLAMVITGVTLLVGALIYLYNNVKPVRDAIDGMVSWVVNAYKSFMQWYDSLGAVAKIAVSLLMPIGLLLSAVKAVVGWFSDLFSSEEKVEKKNVELEASTKKVTVSYEDQKKKIEQITEALKAKQAEEKKGIEDAISGADTRMKADQKVIHQYEKLLKDKTLSVADRRAFEERMADAKKNYAEQLKFVSGSLDEQRQMKIDDAKRAKDLNTDVAKKETEDLIAHQKQLFDLKIQDAEKTIIEVQKIVDAHQGKSKANLKIQVDGQKLIEEFIKISQKKQIDIINEGLRSETYSLDVQKDLKIISEREYNAKIFLLKKQALEEQRDLYKPEQEDFKKNEEALLQLSQDYYRQSLQDGVKFAEEKSAILLANKKAFLERDQKAEIYALDMQKAAGILKEKDYQEKIFQIKLNGLKEQLKLLPVGSAEAKAMYDQIQDAERDHALGAIKAVSDAAKSVSSELQKQVDWCISFGSSINDLIGKITKLNKVENKRNEELDNALEKNQANLDKQTQAKLRGAKTDADRARIQAEATKLQGKLIEGNEKKQKDSADAGTKVSTQEKVSSLISAAAGMVKVIVGILSETSLMGPFGILAAPALIGSAMAMYASVKSAMGMKSGGFTGYGNPNEESGHYTHKNEFVLRSGSFAVDSNGNLVSVAGMGGGNAAIVGAIQHQTERLGEQFSQSTVLNQNRVVLENRKVERSRSRESV